MTSDDVNRIESSLGVSLPDAYRRTLVNFPAHCFAGDTLGQLWDNADALIDVNRRVRVSSWLTPEPWPDHYFVIGDDGAACAYAIDLRDPALPVLWVDHYDPAAPSSGVVSPSLEQWATEWVRQLRENDDFDVDAPPPPPVSSSRLRGFIGCVGWLALWGVAGTVIVLLGILLFRAAFGRG